MARSARNTLLILNNSKVVARTTSKCAKLRPVKNEPPRHRPASGPCPRPPKPDRDPRDLVDEQGFGLGQLSEKLEVKPAKASYHVGVLHGLRDGQAVPAPGNEVEPLFRLTPRSPIGSQRWGEISEAMRGEISTALVRSLIGEARAFPATTTAAAPSARRTLGRGAAM